MGLAGVVLGLVLLAAPAAPIRVYVAPLTADPSGFVDAGTARLRDSHADLIDRLKTRKALTLVTSPEDADCVVTLVSAGWEPVGLQPIGRPIETLRATITAGTYTREHYGQRPTWRGAALMLAAAIEDWAKANRAQLLAQRRTQVTP
jgi:hypothetical protein